MDSLTGHLGHSLPALGSQRESNDPFVYARLFIPGSNRAWYVIEGEQNEDDYIFFAFENRPHYADQGRQHGEELPLSFLCRRAGELVGSFVKNDSSFTPKRLSEALLREETALA